MRIRLARSISFVPFREEWLQYQRSDFSRDILAAVAVALMTIPQSIAYSLLAGLPPTAGLFSAIFGTMFAALWGSSRQLVSGPSTGTAILIQTSIVEIAASSYEGVTNDALVLHILTQLVLLMGIIQITASFCNVSKLLQFVSRPVVLGYFAGIIVAIVVNQLFYFTGIPTNAHLDSIFLKALFFVQHVFQLHAPTTFIGGISLGILLVLRRAFKRFPDALVTLVIASGVSYLIDPSEVQSGILRLKDLGFVSGLFLEFRFPWIDLALINRLFPVAAAISLLAVLEVFSVSKSFAIRKGDTIQPNQDVFGVGIANVLLSCLWGSLPASGSASRTSINVQMGAKTRFAAVASGVFTAAMIYFFWSFVQYIPLAALAALLMMTVPTLMHLSEIRLCLRATQEDAWVLLLTFFSTLVFSLDVAFFIGIVISIATYLLKSSTPHLVEYAFNAKGRLYIISPKRDVHRKVRIIGIGGELYFASADVFESALQSVAEDPNVQAIVLRLNNVHHMDASMCVAILRLYEVLVASKRHLVMSGVTQEVWEVFQKAGVSKKIGFENLYFTDETNPQFSTWKACLRAQELVH